MNKILINFLLTTTVLMYSTHAIATMTKEIDIDDFSKEFLDTCGVVDSENELESDDFGKIFFPKDATGKDRQYITYEDSPCFDLQTMVNNNKITQIDDYDVIKFPEGGVII